MNGEASPPSDRSGWSTVLRILGPSTMAAVLVAVGFGLTRASHLKVNLTGVLRPQASGSRYVPRYVAAPGPQLVMVYVGSSACVWSNEPLLPKTVEAIKLRLTAEASRRGWSFKAIGVAIDWSTEHGIEHLRKFGTFDEVSSGSNWGNSLALLHLWDDSAPTEPATPQVLVYERVFVTPSDTSDILWYGERDRRLLTTRIGSRAIAQWADSGAVVAEAR